MKQVCRVASVNIGVLGWTTLVTVVVVGLVVDIKIADHMSVEERRG